jgi:hypothetical protein
LEVVSRILRLPLGDLQLILQGGHLLLCLANHGLLHVLDLLRVLDLGLQSSLAGRDNLCVGIGHLPQDPPELEVAWQVTATQKDKF